MAIRNQKTAVLVAVVAFLVALLLSIIVYAYLPLHSQRSFLVLALLIGGTATAFALQWVVTRLPDSRWYRGIALVLAALLITAPLTSAALKTVTYSRFGFTVYGIIPVPFLDITVNRNGLLWFRRKTHQITTDEIRKLIDSKTEAIVIADGWDRIANVEESLEREFPQIKIYILSTPDAFKKYNELASDGVSVVMLAHTTC
jgi:hypothetical protein